MLEEVFQDAQVLEYGFSIEVEHPIMGNMRLLGSFIELSRAPPQIKSAPPILGEHTEEILREFGHDKNTIGRLKSAGII